MSNILYEFAKQYKSFGWSIIPILPREKKPAVEWKKYQGEIASNEEIKKWFKDKTTDEVGIGLATGKTSNVIAVDLDTYKEGAKEMKMNTPITSTTGGGGKHGLFQYREGVRNKANVKGNFIDIRGEGGYIVLPPSIHPNGKSYKWDFKEDEFGDRVKRLPAPPAELFDKEWTERKDPLKLSEYTHVGEGGRNDNLYRVACSLVSKHGTDEAWKLTNDINKTYDPPLDDPEVKILFKSAVDFISKSKDKVDNDLIDDFLVGTPILWKDIEAKPMDEKWIWENYIAKGNITLLTAIMKGGKSTLLRCLFDAMAEEAEFAGQPTKNIKTLVISEESEDKWADSKEEANEKTAGNILVWIRPTRGKPNQKKWEEVIKSISDLCVKEKVEFVVIDTLSSFWPIDNENDSAQAARALIPLYRFTESGIGVLLVHHDRKDGGNFGNSSRGSSALTAFVDNIVQFLRNPDGLPSQRILRSWGRFSNISNVVVEYTNEGKYITKGEPWVVSKSARLEKILQIMNTADRPLSTDEIHSIWITQVADTSKRTIRRYMEELKRCGQVDVDREETVRSHPVPFYAPTGYVKVRENRYGQSSTPGQGVVLSVSPKPSLSVSLSASNEKRARDTDRTGTDAIRDSKMSASNEKSTIGLEEKENLGR